MSLSSAPRDGGRAPIILASAGPRLVYFDVDVATDSLIRRDVIELPENVQYAWPHCSGDAIYVACSNGGPGGTDNNRHYLAALAIDRARKRLDLLGEPLPLPSRPVHITTDRPSAFALLAYTLPGGLSVHRINADHSLGELVQQLGPEGLGIYPHQVRVSPDNNMAVLVTRGHDPKNGNVEEPGALKVFAYADGHLAPAGTVNPGGGYGFGPRHVDFHPTKPLLYASLERQNELDVFAIDGNSVAAQAAFKKPTLKDATVHRPRQMTGTIHVHPDGGTVYIANRALGTQDFNGHKVTVGGETAIAVFAIQENGEPVKLQDADTRGADPRTFAIDPSGQLLFAANAVPLLTRHGDAIENTPKGLVFFRIESDGTLAFLGRHDCAHLQGDILWANFVG